MATSKRSPIYPHSDLRPLAANLWVVTGSLPKRHMPRNMVVHRLKSGGLLIHSGIALDNARLTALAALGRPETLIVPNGFHRLDAGWYKDRFPTLKVVCPALARRAVTKVIDVDATCEEALPQLGIKVHAPTGLKPGELIYELPHGDNAALVTTDLMMNLPTLPGMDGLMLKVLGPGAGFGVTRIAKLLLISDKAALRSWLVAQARRRDLRLLICGHGEPIVDNVGALLEGAAARL